MEQTGPLGRPGSVQASHLSFGRYDYSQSKMQSQPKSFFYPFQTPTIDPQLTPDSPSFKNIAFNVAVLTKYGRWIYIFKGNEQKCSSFFATLGTIVNKLQLSFQTSNKKQSQQEKPSKLKCIKHIKQNSEDANKTIFTLYSTKRQNFLYIIWSNRASSYHPNPLIMNSTIDFLHYQLTSCLTAKVNEILNENQTYDPSINFGKGRGPQNLLYYAIKNGLYSIPILFDSLPILPLKANIRQTITSFLKESIQKQQGVQLSIIMTSHHIISIVKKKNIQIQVKDIFLFFNLFQTQSSLSKSENWFPMCLPGLQNQSMLFCYINYLSDFVIQVMIADQSEIFPSVSQISKLTKNKLINTGIIDNIQSSIWRNIINDPSLERMSFVKNFLVKSNNIKQIIMSSGKYFGLQIQHGDKIESQGQIDKFSIVEQIQHCNFMNIYSHLYEHYLTLGKRGNRKQMLHIQTFSVGQCKKEKIKQTNIMISSEQLRKTYHHNTTKCGCVSLHQYLGGYYDEGNYSIFFIVSPMLDLDDCKGVLSSILKYLRQDEGSMFINKYH